MIALDELIEFLDCELKTASIPDYCGAMNGLQMKNSGQVTRIVAAVDASLPVIRAAAAGEGAGLLIVHHGMFWQGAMPITGAFYEKLKIAMDADLAIYSSHLPLDVHPELGNNICLARIVGLENPQPFFDHKSLKIGLRGDWFGSRILLQELLAEKLGSRIHLCPGGNETVRNIGLITGGAGSEIQEVAKSGIDTFVTGEGPHWSYPLAEELGINLIYAGHYATETAGVKSVAKLMSERFAIPWRFEDHPTGL